MQEIFEKIRARLADKEAKHLEDYNTYGHGEDYRFSLCYADAIEIVNAVEEEYRADIVYNLAKRYAVCLGKYGVDISGNFDSAVKMEYVLNQAYMRGRQDEIDRFREHETEYSNSDVTDTNARKSDGWIPVEEMMPNDCDIYEVTAQFRSGKRYTEFAWYDEITDEWRKHDCDGLVNVLAWKNHAALYQPKGE